MSLINFNDNNTPYFIAYGSLRDGSGTNNCFFNIATTVIASNKISKITDSRVSILESGVYEVMANYTCFIQATSTTVVSFQYGLNGSFTTLSSSSPGTSFDLIYNGSFKFCFEASAGDYFEIRNLSTTALTQQTTNPVYSLNSGNTSVPITIKRVR